MIHPASTSANPLRPVDLANCVVAGLIRRPAEARTASWLGATPGRKYLSWDTSSEAIHGTIDLGQCGTPTRAAHCTWMASLGLAYLDAVVLGRPEAIDWLASDAYKTLTRGAIELYRR